MLFGFSGDEFALREGGSLYCKDDHDVLEKSAQSRVPPIIESNNNTNLNNNNHSSELGSMSGKQRTIKYNVCHFWLASSRCNEYNFVKPLICLINKRRDSMSIPTAN